VEDFTVKIENTYRNHMDFLDGVMGSMNPKPEANHNIQIEEALD
jgi:hypothetical protein